MVESEKGRAVLSAEQLLEQLQKEGRSLTKDERAKMRAPLDAIYVRERVRFHGRQQNVARFGLLLVYLTMGLGVFTVFYYPSLTPASQLWMKGTLVVLAVGSLILLSAILVNHGRNATLLRLSRYIQERVPSQAQVTGADAGAVPVNSPHAPLPSDKE